MQTDQLIRQAGGRVTQARSRVLDILLSAERALTHAEIADRLALGGELDRVTLYRTLDWLVEQALAHRVAGEDRVWRFNASQTGEAHDHAHFQCTRCDQVFCLAPRNSAELMPLPQGFRAQHVELSITGLCATCNAAALSPAAAERD